MILAALSDWVLIEGDVGTTQGNVATVEMMFMLILGIAMMAGDVGYGAIGKMDSTDEAGRERKQHLKFRQMQLSVS